MFRGFTAIVYKELLQVRRDPATRFVFLIPIVQMIIFGFAIDMDIQHIRTVVCDHDRSAESRRLVGRFANTKSLDIIGEARSPEEARRQIIQGNAKVAIIIPPQYSGDLLQGKTATVQVLIDGSDSTVATNAMQTARAVMTLPPGSRATVTTQQIPVDVRPRVLFNPDLISSHFYVPGLVGIILQLVTVMLTAFSVVRERERGTLEQLSVTPVSRTGLVLGKIIPYAAIGVLQVIFVLLLMRYVFGVEIEGSRTLLMAFSILFLLPSLALGLLISTIAINQAQAMQMSLMIMLPSVLLSGFAFPRETMPAPIYAVSFLMPVTYYVQVLRGIILRGAGMWALWPQAIALTAFAVVLVTLSAVRFQKRVA